MCAGKPWFGDRGVDDEEFFEKRHPLRYFGLRALLVLSIVLFFWNHPAFAQVPPAQSRHECGSVSDMVLTARVLDQHAIAPELARAVMLDLYADLIENGGDRFITYIDAALRFAKREASRAVKPHLLGTGVRTACMMNQGDLTTIFGVSS